MLFSSIKETNRLISKGTSNTYLKATIEKKLPSQIFDFPRLKNLTLGQCLERLTLCFSSDNNCN